MSEITFLLEQKATYNPVKTYALFSGGHDSICSTYLAMEAGIADAVVHVNTGIGIPQTREFVRQVCLDYEWPLVELHPPGKTYVDIVRQYGFPGSGFHHVPYRLLKERALDILIRESKTKVKDRVMLVTGVRLQESSRRMGNVNPSFRDGAKVWVAPIAEWDDRRKNAYMAEHSIPRNEVVDLLHMSGECLCGSFAHPGELAEIRMWFPEVAAYIDSLAPVAAESGNYSAWGIPRRMFPPNEQLPLCWSCEARYEETA